MKNNDIPLFLKKIEINSENQMPISIHNDGTFRDEITRQFFLSMYTGLLFIIYFKIFHVLSLNVIVLTFTK